MHQLQLLHQLGLDGWVKEGYWMGEKPVEGVVVVGVVVVGVVVVGVVVVGEVVVGVVVVGVVVVGVVVVVGGLRREDCTLSRRVGEVESKLMRGAARSRAVFTSATGAPGCICSTSATAPATWGAAMLVPLMVVSPLSAA